MGCIVAIETAEWTISWLPLYYPIKTIFLLYLALPQTCGSSYLYIHHLQPFFRAYEPQIDATLSSLKTRVYAYLQQTLRSLWGNVANSLGQPQSSQSNILNEDAAVNRGAPPTMSDPVSGPAQLLSTFWSSFGPGILASGAAIIRQAQAAATTSTANTSRNFDSPIASRTNSNSNQAVQERKKQLEAELAALSAQPYDVDSPPAGPPLAMPSAAPGYARLSQTPSDEDGGHGLRERNASSGKLGRFEEVEVPSDAEDARPGSGARNTSWLGWGAGAHEKVKNE